MALALGRGGVSTSVQLLKVAAEIVGGTRELAERLAIGERLLERFIDGQRPLPDSLVLRAMDIVLEGRSTAIPKEAQ